MTIGRPVSFFYFPKQLDADSGGIADQSNDRLVDSLGDVRGDTLTFDPAYQIVKLLSKNLEIYDFFSASCVLITG